LIGGAKGYFSLPLIAADPFSYGAEDTDSFTITADLQTEDVENAGDYNTPPVITVTNNGVGDVVGFTLTTRALK